MTRKQRQQVYDKYNGRCAYTGKPLGDDWQVDHMISKADFFYYAIKMVKKDVSPDEWRTRVDDLCRDGVNDEWNLVPSLRIVNHYKRSCNLEQFRQRMADFHIRLGRLPKKTKRPATVKRIAYMNEVADAFGITPEKPFCGKFYFETIKKE